MSAINESLPRVLEPRLIPARKQSGFMTIAAVLVLITVVMFWLEQSYGIISNAGDANTKQDASVAAFFLAESGVEMANAKFAAANEGGTTDTLCPALSGTGHDFERGRFQYTQAACTAVNGVSCAECNVTVEGKVPATGAVFAARTIQSTISIVNTDGNAGCGSEPSLKMKTTVANQGVFTNLAYRSRPDASMCGGGGGSNAEIGTCKIYDPTPLTEVATCAPNTDGWNLQRTGTNNVSGLGVFSDINLMPDDYLIKQTLVQTGGGGAASRNYVQTGVLLAPYTTGVVLNGSYGKDTGSNKTTGTSATTGSVPSSWNCGLDSANVAVSLTSSAGANTLLYGFSSWPANVGNQLSSLTFGSQPLRKQLSMTGTEGDNLYSQIWYSFNHAYLSDPSIGTARNGASFTGSIGATFKATILDTLLTITDPPNGIISAGDTITYSCTGSCAGSGTAVIDTVVSANVYTLTNPDGGNVSNKAINATSSVLSVTAIASGQLSDGDSVGGSVNRTVIFNGGGTGGVGTYAIGTPQLTVASQSMQSSGTVVRLTGANNIPLEGTAIQATTETVFDVVRFTGYITNSTLHVTVAPVGPSPISVGDALFGPNVKPNTFITGSGGGGTYSVCQLVKNPSPATTWSCQDQTAGTGEIVARPAVRGRNSFVTDPTATLFTVSRTPIIPLNHLVCGGVCAMLNNGADTVFSLTNITTGDDWASGFACVAGVDPSSIKTLGVVSTKRTRWSEKVIN